MDRIRHPQKLGDRWADPDAHDVSLVVLFEGWMDDLLRLHSSLETHLAPHEWEVVVVDNPVDDAASEQIASLPRTVHLPVRDRLGYSAGRNLGLRLATGNIVCVIDTSVELTGDVVPELREALSDERVGLVGRWGVVTHDGFEFEEADGPDVDGVEAYFMAIARANLSRTGLFDPKFRFYRNADLDFSFRVRDAGLRTIVDPSLSLERHEHRLWATTPQAERDELSRKNFFRFRDRWSERSDLFVGLATPP
jgi:GT2 family glycosyltransferase